MNKLYRFSPIQNEESLDSVWVYLVEELEKLSSRILNEALPISILKVFPHYPEEYDLLYKLISQMGPKAPFSSANNLYVNVDRKIQGHHITAMGVRFVDPYRMQVGCGDYEVSDFANYRKEHLMPPYVRDAKDSVEMLEIWNPDSDVLGYVIPKH